MTTKDTHPDITINRNTPKCDQDRLHVAGYRWIGMVRTPDGTYHWLLRWYDQTVKPEYEGVI